MFHQLNRKGVGAIISLISNLNNASLKEIYSEIDQMEKTKISVQEYSKKQEEYKNWALLVFALLLVEILLRNTLLRNIP
mgnify:FL=1